MPCVPQQVTAQMVCTNNTGVVSWEEADGVSSYMVQAFEPSGHKTLCDSTTTNCTLPSLHCGQLYNLTVTAQDGQCNSSHAHQTLQSGLYKFWDTMGTLALLDARTQFQLMKHWSSNILLYFCCFPSALQANQCPGFSAVPLKFCCSDLGGIQRSRVIPCSCCCRRWKPQD